MRMKPFMNDVNSLEGNTEAAREERRRGKIGTRRAPVERVVEEECGLK